MDAPYRPPDDELRAIIEPRAGRVTVIGREENPLASSYPAEIVRSRRADFRAAALAGRASVVDGK